MAVNQFDIDLHRPLTDPFQEKTKGYSDSNTFTRELDDTEEGMRKRYGISQGQGNEMRKRGGEEGKGRGVIANTKLADTLANWNENSHNSHCL
jgi:hypothetical protein